MPYEQSISLSQSESFISARHSYATPKLAPDVVEIFHSCGMLGWATADICLFAVSKDFSSLIQSQVTY